MAQNLFPGMNAQAALARQFTRPQPASASNVPRPLDAGSLRAGAMTAAKAFGRPPPSQRPSAIKPPFQQAKRSDGPTGLMRPPQKGADIAKSGIPSIPGFNLPKGIPGQIAPRMGAGGFVPKSLQRPMTPSQQWTAQPQKMVPNYNPRLPLLSVVGNSGGLNGLFGLGNLGYSYVKEDSENGRYCNKTYPKGADKKQDELNRLCKIDDFLGTKPWTWAGKQSRGLPQDWAAIGKEAGKAAIEAAQKEKDARDAKARAAADAQKKAVADAEAAKSKAAADAAAEAARRAAVQAQSIPGTVVGGQMPLVRQDQPTPPPAEESNTALLIGGAAAAAAAAWFFFLRNK